MPTIPKYDRLGKRGHQWPGVWETPKHYKSRKEAPWRLSCPAPLCFYNGGYKTELQARRVQETHPCPWFGGGTTTISWGVMSDQFLQFIWKDLDEIMDVLMVTETPSEERVEWQGRARGLAQALAILMPPFFHDPDEIAQEALVRWEKKQAGEEYETPGIGRLRFQSPPGADVMTPAGLYRVSPEHDPTLPKRPPAHSLSDQDIAAIRKAKDHFPIAALATAYGVTEAVIKYVQE